MSRKPETVFSTSVHKHLPKGLYRVKNNNPFAGGIPDFWFSGTKGDLWIEYKYVKTLSKNGTAVTLSKLQTKWLRDRYMEGRNVAVVVGCKDGGFILRDLAWENVISPSIYTHNLLPRQAIAQWIQSETGVQHDQIRSTNISSARRAPSGSRQHPTDMRGPVRRPARQRLGTQSESRQ